jgi:aminopeptidase N
MKTTSLSFLIFWIATPAFALEPGLEHTLAIKRSEQISKIAYHLFFHIPENAQEKINGVAKISFSLKSTSSESVVLDFKAENDSVKELVVNGVKEPVILDHQHLMLAGLKIGENEVTVRYESAPVSLNRTKDYLYTLFVPDRASQAFPCFDQPDLKAKFTLELEVVKDWLVVGNEKETSSTENSGFMDHHFSETKPLSTYLFAFAAGKFKKQTAVRDGREMNAYYRESDAEKVAKNLPEVFDLHARALKFLESYTSIPYPYSKFDFVLLPAFQFNGMEHPGAIFYKEKALLLDPSADTYSILARANTISHETAHQWFGDLVTMKWFEDVWLKEVMANLFAAKVVEPLFPQFNHKLKFYLQHAPAAYAIDRSEGTNAIHQDLKNLQDAGSLYGSIIYMKAPIIVNQLESLMGASAFQKGIREYLHHYQFGNASWGDLIAILNRHSKVSLSKWADTWINEAGRPELKVEAAEKVAVVKQYDPANRGRKWIQQFKVLFGTDQGGTALAVQMTGDNAKVSPIPQHQFTLQNSDAVGYGLFRLDDQSEAYLLAHVNEISDPLVRAVAWSALWDEFYETRKNKTELAAAAFQSLNKEADELIAGYVIENFSNLYWQFLTAEERVNFTRKWETALWAKVNSTEKVELRTLYWWQFVSFAQSPAAVADLKKVWSRETKLPGISLSEADELRVTLSLAIRAPKDSSEIIRTEEKRLVDADRKEEFQFLKPTLSADEKVRKIFFLSLKDPAYRRKEPWVEHAVQILSSKLRPNVEYLVKPGLDWLQDIQRTGNVFFPERFIRAVLMGQSTETAANTVKEFLKDHPNYPEDLKGKILQASDLLFRSTSRQ